MEKWKKILVGLSVFTILIIGIFFIVTNQSNVKDLLPEWIKGKILPAGEDRTSIGNFTPSEKEDIALEYTEDNFKVEIGETQINDGFTISKWNEEVKFILEMPEATSNTISPSLSNVDKARINYNDYEVDYYIPTKNVFEFDTILESRPNHDEVSWRINLTNLNCYLQPPLNEENNDTHLTCNSTTCLDTSQKEPIITEYRPMNVVNSYACYHNSKKNNEYQTGKAFHIFRPIISDSNDLEVYGNLSISNGELIVKIPPSFLNEAVYPIIIDPIFGSQNEGGSGKGLNANYARHAKFFMNNIGGNVSNVSAYFYEDGSASDVGAAIYEDGGNYVPTTLINYSGQITTDTWAYQWINFSFGPDNYVQATQPYWLSVFSAATAVYIQYDSGAGDSTGSFNDPWPPSDPATQGWTDDTNIYSIYATYTETGDAPCSGGICEFGYEYLIHDLQLTEDIDIYENQYGTILKFDLDYLCNELEYDSIDEAYLQFYISGKNGGDNDVRAWYVPNQNWHEGSAAVAINNLNKQNETNTTLSSTTLNTFTNISILNITKEACNNDANFTIKIEDPDYLVDTVEAVSDGTSYYFGLVDADLSRPRYQYHIFDSRENTNEARRPRLIVEYTADTAPPYMSNVQKNETYVYANLSVNFTGTANDDSGLSACWLSTNLSGTWENETIQDASGTSHSCSKYIEVNVTNGTWVSWKFYVNDSLGNLANSDTKTFYVGNTNPKGYWEFRAPLNSTSLESGFSKERRYGSSGLGNGYDVGEMWRNGTLDDYGNELNYERRQCTWWFNYFFDEYNYSEGNLDTVYCNAWVKDATTVGMSNTYDASTYDSSTIRGIDDVKIGNSSQFDLVSYFLDNFNFDYDTMDDFNDLSFKANGTYVHSISFPNQRSFCIINEINGSALDDNETLNSTDYDGDGVMDWEEIWTTHTNPYDPDTDDDGHDDYVEYVNEKSGWDPYDWGTIIVYNINDSKNKAYIEIINSSSTEAAVDVKEWNSTLDREFTEQEYNLLAEYGETNWTLPFSADATNTWGKIQANFHYNISQDVDHILDIVVFTGMGYDYGWDILDRQTSLMQIKNQSSLNNLPMTGRKEISNQVFYLRHLKTSNISDYLQDNFLYYGTYIKNNFSNTNPYEANLHYSELWVITGENHIEIISPTTENPVDNSSNFNVTFDFYEEGTALIANVVVENITINDTTECVITDALTYTDGHWIQNCTLPDMPIENYYNVTITANTTTAGQINETEINAVYYQPANTCSCPDPAANWWVECSDNCIITEDCNIRDYVLILNGTGSFYAYSNIFVDTLVKADECKLITKRRDTKKIAIQPY